MNATKRPLSPHLQIYRPQLTSVLSITHRLTGFALSLVILLSPAILYFLTLSKDSHTLVMNVFQNSFVKLVLFLAIFGLSYHLCNGIRHLAWDAGYGLDLDSSYKSGYAVVAISLGITLLIVLTSGAI
jgi:succinate dehydrogenase / fumarate reductase cytochrome b subunit